MSLNLTIYQFAKKRNSTALPPAGTTSRTYTGLLIDNTDIVNPSIRLLYVTNTSNPVGYNYAYIDTINRYYFINTWRWTDEGWVADMTVDVLASFKSQIGAMSLYIERAANAYDGRIIDTYYPARTEVGSNIGTVSWQSPFQNSVYNGSFVIGVQSKDGEYGSIAYYALSYSAMRDLCDALLDDSILQGFSASDASLALQKAIVDPLSFIKSCVFVPLAPSVAGTTAVTKVKIWNWEPDVLGYRLDQANPQKSFSAVISLNDHNQISRGVYMNASPFTRNELFIPTAGKIELDTTITLNHPFLNLVAFFDPRTGEGRVRVYAGENLQTAHYILGDLSANFGVQIQLSQVTRDYIDTAGSTLGVVGDILSGHWGDAFRNAGNALKSSAPHPSSTGGQGSLANLFRNIEFQQIFYQALAEDVARNGRPYCQITTPASITNGGYMQAQKADISISTALSKEIDMISEYLTGGFYYE